MRAVLSLLSFVFLVGCGDVFGTNYDAGDIGGNGTNGGSTTVNASNVNWAQVSYEFLAPNPPDDCSTSEKFVISNGSTWQWDWCEQHKTGSIEYSEYVELNDRIQGVLAVGFVPEVCAELSFPGFAQLIAVFKPDSTKILHTLDRSGSCYTAPSSKVNELEVYVIQLRAKYTGFEINPLVEEHLDNGPSLPRLVR